MRTFYEPEVWIEANGNSYELTDDYYDIDDEAFESSPIFYESIRVMIGDEERALGDHHVAQVIEEAREHLSAAEFKFFKRLGRKIGRGIKKFGRGVVKFGRKAIPIVSKVAQIAAPIAGAVLGGPAGAKIGGFVSKGLGALTKGNRFLRGVSRVGKQVSSISRRFGGRGRQIGRIAGQVGNVAGRLSRGQSGVSSLLRLLQNRGIQQLMQRQAQTGREGESIYLMNPYTGQEAEVAFADVMESIVYLAHKATEETNSYTEAVPSYLQNQYGENMMDNPHSSEERAIALLELVEGGMEGDESNEPYEDYYQEDMNHENTTDWFSRAGLVG